MEEYEREESNLRFILPCTKEYRRLDRNLCSDSPPRACAMELVKVDSLTWSDVV
jgi:hypothetical protein